MNAQQSIVDKAFELARKPHNRTKPSTKQRAMAKLAVQGLSYPVIAERLHMVTDNPSQAVYNRLQDKGTKQAIQQEFDKLKDYNPKILREKLNEVLTNPDDQDTKLKAIALGMKSEGMLVERVEQTNRQAGPDLSKVNETELTSELVKRLRLSSSGIKTEIPTNETQPGSNDNMTKQGKESETPVSPLPVSLEL